MRITCSVRKSVLRLYEPEAVSDCFVMAVEEKIAALEGGVGAMCTSSGQAASLLSILNICQAGDSFISVPQIYGGTINLFSYTFKKMGIECIYVDASSTDEEIKAALQAVDHSLSMFNQNSVISKINRNENVVLDSLFISMFLEAQSISATSKGAFDITVAPLVNAWGFGKSKEKRTQISDIEIDSLQEFVGYEKIVLQNNQVTKQDPRITLDASAIAKGFGCDVVANMLRAKGCKNLLVEIGGEVVLQGVNDNQLRVRVLSYKSGNLILEPFTELLCPGGEEQIVACFLFEHPIQAALESGLVIFQGEV